MKVQPRRDAHFALRLLPLRALGGQDEAYGEAGLLGGAHYFHVAIAFILRLFSTLKRNDHDRLRTDFGCQKCPAFKICPLKSVLGDQPGAAEQDAKSSSTAAQEKDGKK